MLFLLAIILIQRCLFPGCLCNNLSSDLKNSDFMRTLFDGYSENILPVLNLDKPVLISFYMFYLSIDNVDIKSKIVNARIVFGLEWTDEYLKWNPSDFKNISWFTVNPRSVWLPDIYIGSSEKVLTFIKAENVQTLFLYSNGVVSAWLYLPVEVGVDLDIYKYPFDTQIFEIEFSSWMHTNRKIDILDRGNGNQDPAELIRENGEWNVIKLDSNRWIKSYDNYVRNFTIIQYRITLQRRWLYTILNLVAPVVFTSFLNPLSFLLPVDSGERISLSNTVFLTLAVFFSIVNESLPQTSEGVPIIVAYIGLQMLGSALTIVFTIFSLTLYHSHIDIFKSKILKFVFGKREEQNKNLDKNDSDETDRVKTSDRQNDNRKSWKKASNVLDKTCFLLSLAWNIALLMMVFIEINRG